MAVSTFTKNLYQASVVLSDGTGSPVTLTLVGELGDFSVKGLGGEKLNSISVYTSRGKFDSAAYSERIFPEVSFSFKVRELTDASAGAIPDWFRRAGAYSTAISTLGGTAGQKVWAFNVAYTIEGTNFGDSADHTFTLTNCITKSWDYTEGDPSVMAVTLQCLGPITGDLAMTEI